MSILENANSKFLRATMPDKIGVREVMAIAWPIILSMLSFTLVSFVNAAWVGPLGTAHLAAVGLGTVLLYAVHGFGSGILSGLKVGVAQAHGEGDDLRARRLAWQGLRLAVVMGAIEVLFIPLGEPLLRALGASDEAAPLAASYFAARVWGAIPAFIMAALSQYLLGRGRTVHPMVAMVIANVVNLALDPMFIYGFGPIPAMDIAGAGWAASIGFSVGAVYLVLICRRELGITPRLYDRKLFARIWELGLPLGARMSLEVVSFMLFQAVLSACGDAHLAAHVLVVQTIKWSFLPGYAVSEATAVLVGQAVGARRLDLVPQIEKAGLWIASSFMVACGIVFLLFPEALSATFGAKPDVVAIAANVFIVAAAFQVFDAWCMVGLGVLNGAGDTRFVMISSVGVAWLVKLPVGWALASGAGMGAVGAWWGILAECVVLWLMLRWRLRGGAWKSAAMRSEELALAEAV